MSALQPTRQGDRELQLRLDACLTELENAHERDEQIVSPGLARRVGLLVPGVVSRMPIGQAIDLVFQAQDACLQGAGGNRTPLIHATALRPAVVGDLVASQPEVVRVSDTMDAVEARALTERIKSVANNISVLLLEAQERRAWLALGYHTWERYVRHEFGLSRTRSYELLDHGRLIRAIQAMTGAWMVGTLPPYAARKVKPHLEQFILELKSRAAGKNQEEIPSIVSEIIQTVRPGPAQQGHAERRAGTSELTDRVADAVAMATSGPHRYTVDLDVLQIVIEYLAAMPSATGVAHQLTATETDWRAVDRATVWLDELAAELRRRSGRASSAGAVAVPCPALPMRNPD